MFENQIFCSFNILLRYILNCTMLLRPTTLVVFVLIFRLAADTHTVEAGNLSDYHLQ
jgi:hypothetical protein